MVIAKLIICLSSNLIMETDLRKSYEELIQVFGNDGYEVMEFLLTHAGIKYGALNWIMENSELKGMKFEELMKRCNMRYIKSRVMSKEEISFDPEKDNTFIERIKKEYAQDKICFSENGNIITSDFTITRFHYSVNDNLCVPERIFLGYPKCCWYSATNHRFRIDVRKKHDEGEDMSFLAFVSHVPCNIDCKETMDMAKRNIEFLAKICPEYIEAIKEKFKEDIKKPLPAEDE